ncbi:MULTISPECIES: hypothetical protein [unclassified Rhizobium]|uniref:hypothetical protein n=1 Tax=unclassified Rhizobium TaxID=2613769 RepID=UPI00382113ED
MTYEWAASAPVMICLAMMIASLVIAFTTAARMLYRVGAFRISAEKSAMSLGERAGRRSVLFNRILTGPDFAPDRKLLLRSVMVYVVCFATLFIIAPARP